VNSLLPLGAPAAGLQIRTGEFMANTGEFMSNTGEFMSNTGEFIRTVGGTGRRP
jgi:hypothetical protein